MAKIKDASYKARVLAGLNKTEAQIQEELVDKFQAYGSIDCERQISLLESEIKERTTDLRLDKQALELTKKEAEKATYSLATNYESWVRNQNLAAAKVVIAEIRIIEISTEILKLQAELAKHQANLVILQS